MEKKSDAEKLKDALSDLAKADRQIQNLLKERKQNQMMIKMLETAGFITEDKLEEARGFVQTFLC